MKAARGIWVISLLGKLNASVTAANDSSANTGPCGSREGHAPGDGSAALLLSLLKQMEIRLTRQAVGVTNLASQFDNFF